MTPTAVFLTRGVGRHPEKLGSFEQALRDAGIAHLNLVEVSSILPPGCAIVEPEEGLRELAPGQITFTVLARASTDEPHRLISAAVGVAVPSEPGQHGYLSEVHAFGISAREAARKAEMLAASMLATTLGVPVDPDMTYEEQRRAWKISGKIYRTLSIAQSAKGSTRYRWTTVVCAAVFCRYA